MNDTDVTDDVIDFHAHWLPSSAITAGQGGSDWHGAEVSFRSDGIPVVQAEDRTIVFGSSRHQDGFGARISDMDDDRVDVQVLSMLPPLYRYALEPRNAAAYCTAMNDELAAEIAASDASERFNAMGILPLQSPSDAASELIRCIDDLGFVGVAVGTSVGHENWNATQLWDVLEAAEATNAVVFIHPAAERRQLPLPGAYYLANLIGNPTETTIALASLVFSGALERFPRARLLLAHGGGYAALALGRMVHGYHVRDEPKADITRPPLEQVQSVYVDTIVHSGPGLRFLVDMLGADRIVLGTDFPADMGQPSPVEFVQNGLAESPEVVRSVLTTNATHLLNRT